LRFRCEHGHNGISHRNCFDRSERIDERIGFFDIETSDLSANIGIMLSYCIKPEGSDEILHGVVTQKELMTPEEDKRVVKQCAADLKKFDRVVVFWGKDRRHDLPFIRTRAIEHKVMFPLYREVWVTDCWDWAKTKLRLNSNRQVTVAKQILGETEKTQIDWRVWRRAGRGNKECLAEVLDHNMRDVRDLERIYHTLLPYVRNHNASI